MAMAQELASPKVAIVEAQILIDKGEIVNAIELLKNANQQFPGNDILLILYGDALYENKQMALAEQAYMQALEINPLSPTAAKRIEVIRAISNASVSEKAQQLEE